MPTTKTTIITSVNTVKAAITPMLFVSVAVEVKVVVLRKNKNILQMYILNPFNKIVYTRWKLYKI